jgi:hypothetical protein
VYDLENNPRETETLDRQHSEWVEELKTLFLVDGFFHHGTGNLLRQEIIKIMHYYLIALAI